MQITNKLINIQKSNPVNFNNSVEKKNNSPVINNTNLADSRLSFMGETTNAALKAIAFSAKPEGYKKIGKFQVPFYNDGHVYELNNGQKVIIIPKPGPVTINTYVKVGSMNEPEDIGGISHYIEHSLFNGSKKLKPGQFMQDIEKIGADASRLESELTETQNTAFDGEANELALVRLHEEISRKTTVLANCEELGLSYTHVFLGAIYADHQRQREWHSSGGTAGIAQLAASAECRCHLPARYPRLCLGTRRSGLSAGRLLSLCLRCRDSGAGRRGALFQAAAQSRDHRSGLRDGGSLRALSAGRLRQGQYRQPAGAFGSGRRCQPEPQAQVHG